MKVLLICALCLFMSCLRQTPEETSIPTTIETAFVEKSAVLNIVVNDISKSDLWLTLKKHDISDLLLSDSNRVKSNQLAGILINDQGTKQHLYLSPVISLALSPETGDIYKRVAAESHNRKIRQSYRQFCLSTADSFDQHIILPRTVQWSDVNGGLELAARLSYQNCYRHHQIRLIVLSDFLHDMPNGGILEPIEFPPNVVIYVTGQDASVNLKSLFPSNRVILIPHFDTIFFTQS